MSAGNPELVIHDGKLIRRFIDDILSGGNVDVHIGSRIHRLGDPNGTTGDDGMPWINGVVLDENYEPEPLHDSQPSHFLQIPWESITRIEVW